MVSPELRPRSAVKNLLRATDAGVEWRRQFRLSNGRRRWTMSHGYQGPIYQSAEDCERSLRERSRMEAEADRAKATAEYTLQLRARVERIKAKREAAAPKSTNLHASLRAALPAENLPGNKWLRLKREALENEAMENFAKCMEPGLAMIEFKCKRCGAAMDGVHPCPECRSPSRATRYFCNGAEYASAAEAWAMTWANLAPSDRKWMCMSCAREYSIVSDSGATLKCPHCGHSIFPSEKRAEEALTSIKMRQDAVGQIDHIAQLLGEPRTDSGSYVAPCHHCRRELPSVPSHSELYCPHCGHYAYVFRAESFKGLEECQKIMEFRLQKKNLGVVSRNPALGLAIVGTAAGSASDEMRTGGGLLYVLVNSSMPNLVKIGKTERDTEARARELSCSTGVPTPFLVAYEEWFDDCSDAENQVHRLLESQGFRIADNREFFCVPVKAAIQALMNVKEQQNGVKGL